MISRRNAHSTRSIRYWTPLLGDTYGQTDLKPILSAVSVASSFAQKITEITHLTPERTSSNFLYVLELLVLTNGEITMKFVVGGRGLELTQSQVVEAVVGFEPEVVREYFVELPNGWFPPKQVLAIVTQWDRSTFTSHEAVRILSRLGLACRRVDQLRIETELGQGSMDLSNDENSDQRCLEVASSIKVLEAAVAGIIDRLSRLESVE
jgi:hypothetical protein